MRGAAPTLHCPRCKAPAAPGPTFVTCAACALVFDTRAGEQAMTRPSTRLGRRRDSPDADPMMRVDEDGERLVVSWPWPRPIAVVMLVVAAPLVALCVLAFRDPWWPVLLVLTPLTALVVYATLALAFNRTVVTVDRLRFVTRHRPFPLQRGHLGPVRGIEQVFVQRIQFRRKEPSYRVVAAYADRPDVPADLVQHGIAYTTHLALARELETRIERYLGLVDRAYGEELPLDEDA